MSAPRATLSTATTIGLLLLGMFAGGLLTERAEAEPPEPKPGPSTRVLEQNVDEQGLIRVHEQGIAKVDVTNQVLQVEGAVDVDNFPTSLSVNNFPAVQEVEVLGTVQVIEAPATRVEGATLVAQEGSTDAALVPPLNVSMVALSGLRVGVRATVALESPLNGGTSMTFAFGEDVGTPPFYNLAIPFPVDGLSLSCSEGDDECVVFVTLYGR